LLRHLDKTSLWRELKQTDFVFEGSVQLKLESANAQMKFRQIIFPNEPAPSIDLRRKYSLPERSKIWASLANRHVAQWNDNLPELNQEISQSLIQLLEGAPEQVEKILLSPAIAPLWTVAAAEISPLRNQFTELFFIYE
jgi:hypothetical protein